MEEETKALQVRFPTSMYNRLTEMAKKSRRSLNAEIITCMEAYLTGYEEALESPLHVGSITVNLDVLRTYTIEDRKRVINSLYITMKNQLLVGEGYPDEPEPKPGKGKK